MGGNISLEVGFVSLKTSIIPSFLLALQDVSSQLPLAFTSCLCSTVKDYVTVSPNKPFFLKLAFFYGVSEHQ